MSRCYIELPPTEDSQPTYRILIRNYRGYETLDKILVKTKDAMGNPFWRDVYNYEYRHVIAKLIKTSQHARVTINRLRKL